MKYNKGVHFWRWLIIGVKKNAKGSEGYKGYIFKVKMDNETTRKLKTLSEFFNTSLSEVARLSIEKLYEQNIKD